MHPRGPARARTDWKAVFVKLAGAAVPILTLGAGSPVLMGVLAYRRRRLWLRSFGLWASVGVYLGVSVPFWADDWEANSTYGAVVMVCQLAAIAAASVQAAIVIGSQRKHDAEPVDLNEASAEELRNRLIVVRPQDER